MTIADILAGLAILIGLAGIVVPILPGSILIGVAVVGWAVYTGGEIAWLAAGIAVAVLVLGTVVRIAVPHRQLRDAGVPRTTILVGGILGIVGFFVIPVVGLFLGFIGGVWLAEAGRLGSANAGPSTRSAVRAVGLSILIELAAGLMAAIAFVVGAVMA